MSVLSTIMNKNDFSLNVTQKGANLGKLCIQYYKENSMKMYKKNKKGNL